VRGPKEVGSSPAPAQERQRFKRNRRRVKARYVSNATELVEENARGTSRGRTNGDARFRDEWRIPHRGHARDGGAGSQRALVLKRSTMAPSIVLRWGKHTSLVSLDRRRPGRRYRIDAVLCLRSIFCFRRNKRCTKWKKARNQEKYDVSWKRGF
jgi:hypothetical protein